MNQEQVNLFLSFDSYSTYSKIRTKNPEFGGGTALIVRNNINKMAIKDLDKEHDHVGLKIELEGLSFNIFSLYSPANSLKTDILSNYMSFGTEILITGDLNSNTPVLGCKSTNTNDKILEEILISSELDLCVLNDESPTYFKFKSEYTEILDLFLCSKSLASKMSHFEVLKDFKMDSDHAPILCILELNNDFRKEQSYHETRFNFNLADWKKFKSILDQQIDQFELLDPNYCPDIEDFSKTFSSIVLNSGDQAIPKMLTRRAKSFPPHIIRLIKDRRNIRKKLKKCTFESGMN